MKIRGSLNFRNLRYGCNKSSVPSGTLPKLEKKIEWIGNYFRQLEGAFLEDPKGILSA